MILNSIRNKINSRPPTSKIDTDKNNDKDAVIMKKLKTNLMNFILLTDHNKAEEESSKN